MMLYQKRNLLCNDQPHNEGAKSPSLKPTLNTLVDLRCCRKVEAERVLEVDQEHEAPFLIESQH